jgi:FHA domain-containing protein
LDEPLAVALKFGFLAVLYLFLLWVSRSALKDLSRYEDVALGPEEGDPASRRAQQSGLPDLAAGIEPRLEVVAAMGYEPGTTFDLSGGATLGRADSAEIRVDDPYASSAHARIFARGEFMYIEDMGSTNGTYLNGRSLRTAERLKMGDVVRIGDSEYRYEE